MQPYWSNDHMHDLAANVEVHAKLKGEVETFPPPHYGSSDPVTTIAIVCGVVVVVIVFAMAATIITAIKLILRTRQTTTVADLR